MPNRLVIASNRVPPPPTSEHPWPAGGLVSAILPALERSGNAVWFGWSGHEGDPTAISQHVEACGVEYATIDLRADQVEAYYEDFCNGALWPLMHNMGNRVSPAAGDSYQAYREVNRTFARSLMTLLEPDDLLWIHDYHLMPLAQEIREAGWDGRIGYFHHTPVPAPPCWDLIPYGAEIASTFEAYDVIGVQTERDRRHLQHIVGRRVGARVASYPAAIDADRFRDLAVSASGVSVDADGSDRMLFFGVDRLDYTKGIPQRLEAFERALSDSPDMTDGARFVQWSAPSRAAIPEYVSERCMVEQVADRVIERFGSEALQVEFESHPPPEVAAALRDADVCVISSVADGMNLVAKEFAAVHSEERPGVLVLSDSCGAAEELTEALIFPAEDIEAMAKALKHAFVMPDEERRARSRALRDIVDSRTSGDWMRDFVADLQLSPARVPIQVPVLIHAGPDDSLPARIERRLEAFERNDTVARIWRGDHTLWKPEPHEISDRLGWLDINEVMAAHTEDLQRFAADVDASGYTTLVLLGIGGSSAAPRVFASTFAGETNGRRLILLDSTVPDAITSVEHRLDPGKTLFIASSKSGTTLETRALVDYFWDRYPDGRHWVAITDGGSPLQGFAEERSFRRVFQNPSNLGGRYSALSFFGLVPAVLLGLNIERILGSAAEMRKRCAEASTRDHPGARLGATLGEAALMGRDYLSLRSGPDLPGFDGWLEQLIAESTGKEGRGILPIIGEGIPASTGPGRAPRWYTIDARQVDALTGCSFPLESALGEDPYALGGEFFRWEFGVAMAGCVLGINPFDQPDVEATKVATRRILDEGVSLSDAPVPQDTLAGIEDGDYLAVHAYLARTREHDARLANARDALQERLHVPVTIEYGPSLLHSTGQYHKGGPRRGHFIQVMDSDDLALAIPERAYAFADLKNAQAEGDRLALETRGLAVGRCTIDGLEEAS